MSQNALDKALAGGAIGFVARKITEAVHPFVIVNELRQAYKGLNMTEVGQVYQLGAGARSAGQEIAGPGGQGIAPLDTIPVNPKLFASIPSTNQFRFQTIVEYAIPGENQSRYATLNVATQDNLSLAQLQAMVDQLFSQLTNRGGRYVGQTTGAAGVVQSISVLDVERAF